MNLPRVLEPEVMDTAEEAHDYNDMDHSLVNSAFVADMMATGLARGDVLDLGTGTAWIPIELCRQCDHCRIMAVDLSIHMLDLARMNIEVAGLIERIQLDHIDAKQLPYEDGSFDVVMSNSIVHHLADPTLAVREAVRVVRPGGLLFFRDLMRPDTDAVVARLVAEYAGNECDHARQMFDDSLRAALRLEEMRAIVAALDFDPQTVQATSDRHWTWRAAGPPA